MVASWTRHVRIELSYVALSYVTPQDTPVHCTLLLESWHTPGTRNTLNWGPIQRQSLERSPSSQVTLGTP